MIDMKVIEIQQKKEEERDDTYIQKKGTIQYIYISTYTYLRVKNG